MRMRWIDPAERGEELSGFQLQIEWQTRRLQERFFNFDIGVVVVVEFEDNIGESFEVGIDRAIEREFDVARVKSALLRIVIPALDVTEIARARTGQGKQSIERDVHVILSATDRDRLSQRRTRTSAGDCFCRRGPNEGCVARAKISDRS